MVAEKQEVFFFFFFYHNKESNSCIVALTDVRKTSKFASMFVRKTDPRKKQSHIQTQE